MGYILHSGAVIELTFCLFVFYKVGDVRVRFSFAGLSGETTHLGQAQTVSAADICLIISGHI